MRSLEKIFKGIGVARGDQRFHPLYEERIGPRRDEALHLFEVGIFKGKSLRAWLEWLPKATVFAMDTFERIPPEELEVLKDPRVTWYRKSSCGKAPRGLPLFDYIIDDGCHWHCAQRMTFSRYWPYLRAGGSYFIEDVWPFDLMSEEDKKHSWILNHPGAWTDDAFAGLLHDLGMAGEVIRHDFRQGENSDRYVLEIVK